MGPETKPITTSLGCPSKLESTSTSRRAGAASGSDSHRGRAALRQRKEGTSEAARSWTKQSGQREAEDGWELDNGALVA